MKQIRLSSSPIFIFTAAILLDVCGGANILFFFGVATYSHRISVWPLVEKLADNGHNVTFMTAHPAKTHDPSSKIKEYAPKFAQDYIKRFMGDIDFVKNRETGEYKRLWDILPFLGMGFCEVLLKDPSTMQWLRSSQFDLVVIDSLYNDCGIGFAHIFGAKYAVFGTTSLYMWHADSYGFPAETSWIPDMQYHPPLDMNFLQRLWTTFRALRWNLFREWYMMPHYEKLFRNALNETDMPPFKDLEKNISLVLMNTHFSEEFGRSLPPLVVSVGGMHCSENIKPPPKDIEKFIEDGTDSGFVFVSFGSAVPVAKMEKEKQEILFNAFANSKTKFIVKWEGDVPQALSPNILIFNKWLPQQDILGHPKIKGFISHGGLLGIQEAIYHGVPMILFPFFAEQDYNCERIHKRGHGIRLEFTTVTTTELQEAIASLLTDKSYHDKVQKLSKVFKDRPMKPLDLAVWWTEYVLRHEDTSSLQPLGIHQNWFVRRLIDVWWFLLFIFTLISYGAIILLLKLLRRLLSLYSDENEDVIHTTKLKTLKKRKQI